MVSNVLYLPKRATLLIRGSDAVPFLQALITNDMRLLESRKGISAMLLNTQGRIVEDMLLWKRGNELLLECSVVHRDDLLAILNKYKMRKKVEIENSPDRVFFIPGKNGGDLPDPRLADFGCRQYSSTSDEGQLKDGTDTYNRLRFEIGLSEGPEELANMLPFQANADLFKMVSFDKGCYIGQELTARTANTGVIRRRILPFYAEAKVSGEVKHGENSVGKVLNSDSKGGLAIFQLNSFSRPLTVGGVPVKPFRPSWMPEKIILNYEKRTSLTDD
ncbi:hypothetical protein WR25_00604 [Diploscapter pachys]|uniref:CAF17 C-terminal domain-containing protein n=1 Tax=Diploscapter pachys TaxID=2018661 RepID=A0A2A2KI80_9BILA|nr:hypothetical protein WR25_00604 [Diploscapter pachys]